MLTLSFGSFKQRLARAVAKIISNLLAWLTTLAHVPERGRGYILKYIYIGCSKAAEAAFKVE